MAYGLHIFSRLCCPIPPQNSLKKYCVLVENLAWATLRNCRLELVGKPTQKPQQRQRQRQQRLKNVATHNLNLISKAF